MRMPALLLLLLVALAVTAAGQCTGPDPASFGNNTSATGMTLNCATGGDSTANSLFTAGAQDNIALATAGEAVSFQIGNAGGPAGAPLGLYYTSGSPVGPIPLASGDNVYLNFMAGMTALVDGIGLVSTPPNSYAVHPGPGLVFALFGAVAANPSLGNTCWTFQSALLDPASAVGVRISNAIRVAVRPGITDITPNFAAEGTTVTITNSGSGTGTCHFGVFNPPGAIGPATVATAVTTGTSFTVPANADSGPVAYEDVLGAGNLSTQDPDSMTHHLAVVDPMGVAPGTPGPITLNASPYAVNEQWKTLAGTLASSTTIDAYTVTAAAGDILQVELYSVNVTQSRILNGYGSTFDPSATHGFDPLVEIFHTTNVNSLAFDNIAGATLVHGDDDSGPAYNSRAVFQVRNAGGIRIDVRASSPATFVTGDYLLNIRVYTGAPAVTSFTISGLSSANLAAPGTTVTIVGANFTPGIPCTVTLNPRHGLYAPVAVVGTVVSSTQATFPVPAFSTSMPYFCVGSHEVSVTDGVSGATSLLWQTSYAGLFNGIKPDLLVLRAGTLTPQGTGAPAITPNISTVTQSGAANFGGFLTIAATGTQNIYIECLGLDTTSTQRRVDCMTPVGGGGTGVYNPHISLMAPGYLPIIAQNDDNGLFPVTFPWVGGGGVGIGRNSALVTPASFGNGNYLLYYVQNITVGASPYEAIVNVVVL